MTFRKYFFLACFGLIAPALHAQNMKDAGCWLATSFSANLKDLTSSKLPKTLKGTQIYVDPEFRFDENIGRLYGYFADVGLTKKISDQIQFIGEYRIGGKRELDAYILRKRLSLGMQWSVPVGDFKFSSTTRFQMAHVQSSDLDLKASWRQKFAMEYAPWDKWGLQLSHEFFLAPISYSSTNWRSQFQVKYKLSKNESIALGYLVQRDLENADMDFVILASYKWQFKPGKSKKQD